ncbi:uncharacterized protein VTP21DRAFT_8255 [Calcarisporiella thermophila]|uniref:uncharacterized protein n=1 Tax=Calcarisporiella thermophila TaxID=911321 RepID=UPI003743DBED
MTGILHSTVQRLSKAEYTSASILDRDWIYTKGLGEGLDLCPQTTHPPKPHALRWRILVEKVIANSTFPDHDPKLWQWVERCNFTSTGPQNPQVLAARNLILGDLSEFSRTARHVAQITFDSVLWQIHRDRMGKELANPDRR